MICAKCKKEKEKENGQECFSMVDVPAFQTPEGKIRTITKPIATAWVCFDCLDEVKKGQVQGFSIGSTLRRDKLN